MLHDSPGRVRAPQRLSIHAVIALGVLSGLTYCSWPLGYLTNPALVAHGLASDLEARGVPYAWLFITLDCVSGAATLAAGLLVGRRLHQTRIGLVAVFAYTLSGSATAFDALSPLHCPTGQLYGCGANLANPNLDAVITGFAMTALAVAVIAALALRREWRPLPVTTFVAAVAWATVGVTFLHEHFVDVPPVALQHANLTLTALLLALLPPLLVEPTVHARAGYPGTASAPRGRDQSP